MNWCALGFANSPKRPLFDHENNERQFQGARSVHLVIAEHAYSQKDDITNAFERAWIAMDKMEQLLIFQLILDVLHQLTWKGITSYDAKSKSTQHLIMSSWWPNK